MARRAGAGEVLGHAAAGPLNLAVLGGAVLAAIVLASWPIAALGGAAYTALVASDVSSAEFRRRVRGGRLARLARLTRWRPARLPDPESLTDPEVRAAAQRIAIARGSLDEVVKILPDRIGRNVTAALAAIDELDRHGAALARRADELSRYLAGTDAVAALREAESLAARATNTPDPDARASYEAAAHAAHERVTALSDIATARDRTLAHLTRIESAIKAVPSKLVRLRALDDQASDALTGEVGAELERMNIDLRAFEQTLESLVEVPS
jgi:hypothetical protein